MSSDWLKRTRSGTLTIIELLSIHWPQALHVLAHMSLTPGHKCPTRQHVAGYLSKQDLDFASSSITESLKKDI